MGGEVGGRTASVTCVLSVQDRVRELGILVPSRQYGRLVGDWVVCLRTNEGVRRGADTLAA